MIDPELADLPLPTRGYLLGAALVSRFRPEHLMPLDWAALTIMQPSAEDRRAGLSYVIGNSHPVGFDDPSQFRWSLDDDLRRRVLDSLGSLNRIRDALHNVTCQPPSDEPLWEFFESDPAATTQSLCALSNRRQALVWLQSYFHADELRDLDRQIERTGLIAPLQRLVGTDFVGRSTELEFLRHFVGVLPSPPEVEASTLVGTIARNIGTVAASARELWDWVTSPGSDADVLLVTGPGGIGKSALLARFLLQHWEAEPQLRTPFAFLDFDRPSLISRDMRVLLEEIGRQLSIECGVEIEVPWSRREANSPGTSFAQVTTAPRAEMMEASDADRSDFRKQQEREYVHGVARVLHESSFGSRPLLLVLDTLERVFRRGRHWITALDDMIGMLRTESIDVRVVASGRAFLAEQQAKQALGSRGIHWRERRLSELLPDASEALLVRRGLSADQARMTVKQIGGVPLSLCLAADYLKRRGSGQAHLGDLTRSWLLKRRLEDRVIQGNLYQRILSHVEVKDVAPLVSPGLILREITPLLISEVLAKPCGLGEVSEERAKRLFAGLAQEFTLVDDVGGNRLKHRADVRQVMLGQMLGSEQNRARQVSEAAVHYYEKFSDPKNRAEELYHRLLLGEDKEVIELRWLTGVEEYLGDEIIDDIPSIPLRVFAATQLKLEVSDQEWLRQADAETWERKITQDLEARLKLGQVREALQLVSGRAEFTPGSRLYPLVAQAFADIRDYPMAERWIDAGMQLIDNVADAMGRQTLVPLYLVRARIFEHIAERAGARPDFVAGEIEQFDALWADHRGDTRVILIALLELEVFERQGTLGIVELQRWLENHVASVQADGGTIEPNVAIRVLPELILGSAGPSLDLARWLIDVPGVRGALAQLLRRFAAWQLSATETLSGELTEQLVSRLELDNPDTDGTGRVRNLLSVDEVTALARAIRLSAKWTRLNGLELRGPPKPGAPGRGQTEAHVVGGGFGGPVGEIAKISLGTPPIVDMGEPHGLATGVVVRVRQGKERVTCYVRVDPQTPNQFSAYRHEENGQPADLNGFSPGAAVDRLNAEDWAIVAGINYYPGLTNLKGPRLDSALFERWVMDWGFVPDDQTICIPSSDAPPGSLALAQPTQATIEDAFHHLIRRAQNKKFHRLGRRLYIFFSGHGIVATRAPYPEWRDVALLMADADPLFLSKNVAARAWAEWFRALAIFDEVFLFADCCVDVEDLVPPTPILTPPWRLARASEGRGFYAFSTKLGRKAWEKPLGDPPQVRGILGFAVNEALKNPRLYDEKGQLTVSALANHLYWAVPKYSNKQAPVIEYEKDPFVPEMIVAKWLPRAKQKVQFRFTAVTDGNVADLFAGNNTNNPLKSCRIESDTWVEDLDAGSLYKISIRGSNRKILFETMPSDEVQVVTV